MVIAVRVEKLYAIGFGELKDLDVLSSSISPIVLGTTMGDTEVKDYESKQRG
ncbi:hypothetical protein [Rickettsiales endosymbiont of Peranema trichophorum]|uniref:hypothetical protein n=1 Tax=Rickettsiales endosymbiont of Peranema trichophorum TaxID=2486577 RepID=UPI001A93199C|nr:hypothetical protein [Rickettsiales endosymbiont of Peranema trichophorum]